MKRIVVFLIALLSLNLAALSSEQEESFLKKTLFLQGKTPFHKVQELSQGAYGGAVIGAIFGGLKHFSSSYERAATSYPTKSWTERFQVIKIAAPELIGINKLAGFNSYRFNRERAIQAAGNMGIGAAIGAASGATVVAGAALTYRYYLLRQIDAVLAKSMPSITFKELSPYAAMLCYAAYKKDFGMIKAALRNPDAQRFFNQPGAREAVAQLAKLSINQLFQQIA